MSELSTTEIDLIWFFGSQPVKTDPADIPWPYNDLLFNIAGDNWRVRFLISPAYQQVELSAHIDEQLLYQLSIGRFSDLVIHHDSGHATLEIVISEKQSIFLCLAPRLFISQDIRDVI